MISVGRQCRRWLLLLVVMVVVMILMFVTDRLSPLGPQEASRAADGMGGEDGDAGWREAMGSSSTLFLYSAYQDNRTKAGPHVWVVAVARMDQEIKPECSLWSHTRRHQTVTGRLVLYRNKHEFVPYYPATVICPLPQLSPSFGLIDRVSVSFTLGQSANYSASLIVQHPESRAREGTLNVCVKPFLYAFDQAVSLVEFIEFYRLLGVEGFTFYEGDLGPNLKRVLNYYTGQGIIEVLPWGLPLTLFEDIWDEASLNDCILRSIGRFPLTLMVDVDEFIIPRSHDSLPQLVEALGHHKAYAFLNKFFYLPVITNQTWVHTAALQDSEKNILPQLLTMSKLMKADHYFEYPIRSKYIARPEWIANAGTHKVDEFIGDDDLIVVADALAVSQHYRDCSGAPNWVDTCTNETNVEDLTAHRFMRPLLAATASVCRTVFPEQPSCPPLTRIPQASHIFLNLP